jgi:hypothetical protein
MKASTSGLMVSDGQCTCRWGRSPTRAKFFPNSAGVYLKVHSRGAKDADVIEGSRGVSERLHYDWSDASRVVMTTTDSDVWGGSAGHTRTFTRKPDGRTDVDAVVIRERWSVHQPPSMNEPPLLRRL